MPWVLACIALQIGVFVWLFSKMPRFVLYLYSKYGSKLYARDSACPVSSSLLVFALLSDSSSPFVSDPTRHAGGGEGHGQPKPASPLHAFAHEHVLNSSPEQTLRVEQSSAAAIELQVAHVHEQEHR